MLAKCVFLTLAGMIQSQMQSFIVGGGLTSINRYPHSAFLTIFCVTENKKKANWICGSSIVNQRILLTAGHCVYLCGVGTRISVNMGHEHRGHGLVRSASGYLIHEKYNPNRSDSDIGLIKMSVPITFNRRISRVALMKSPPYSEPANLAGWGLTDENTKIQGINLKEVDQKVWRHNSCLKMFGKLPKGTICASSQKQQDFAAQGDSGSGLVVRGYIQIGLVSYKIPGVANNVIIYTDVGYYFEWITYHARRLYCSTLIL